MADEKTEHPSFPPCTFSNSRRLLQVGTPCVATSRRSRCQCRKCCACRWWVRWSPRSHCTAAGQPAWRWVVPCERGLLRGDSGRSCPSVCDSPSKIAFLLFFSSLTLLSGMLLDLVLGFCPVHMLFTKNLSHTELFFHLVKKAFSSWDSFGPALCRAARQHRHLPSSAVFSFLQRKTEEVVQAPKTEALQLSASSLIISPCPNAWGGWCFY